MVLDYVRLDEYPAGVRYAGRDFDDLQPGKRFGAILICHVLEHAVRPLELVSRAAEHLSDVGVVYIEVPLVAFREWRRLSEPLTHVRFFSEESVFNLARLAGLNVFSLSTDYQWVTHGGK